MQNTKTLFNFECTLVAYANQHLNCKCIIQLFRKKEENNDRKIARLIPLKRRDTI
jgi:hypothetical protein